MLHYLRHRMIIVFFFLLFSGYSLRVNTVIGEGSPQGKLMIQASVNPDWFIYSIRLFMMFEILSSQQSLSIHMNLGIFPEGTYDFMMTDT